MDRSIFQHLIQCVIIIIIILDTFAMEMCKRKINSKIDDMRPH